jgi:hypothetical protein
MDRFKKMKPEALQRHVTAALIRCFLSKAGAAAAPKEKKKNSATQHQQQNSSSQKRPDFSRYQTTTHWYHTKSRMDCH